MVAFVISNCLAHLFNMTEIELKERLQNLDSQRKQMEANLNAIAGAMQECQFWLNKITSPVEETEKD